MPLSTLLLGAMPRLHTLRVQVESRGGLDLQVQAAASALATAASHRPHAPVDQWQRPSRLGPRGCPALAGASEAAAIPAVLIPVLNSMHLLPPAVEALRSLSAITFAAVSISEDAGRWSLPAWPTSHSSDF